MVKELNGTNKSSNSSFVESQDTANLMPNNSQPSRLNTEKSPLNQGNIPVDKKFQKSFLQPFYNLPISRKQWIALLASELISILGIGIVGTLIINRSLRDQLFEQAKSELAVTDINYNIKVNQMGFGFRGQSDNSTIIKASVIHDSGKALNSNLKTEVKQILQNEIKARNIEYATLVGKDLKIIVNANNDRTGEEFNPDNLVQEAINNSQKIKANSIVSWSELTKELPPLPSNFTNQNALIRYTIIPVQDSTTKIIVGALVAGDIVNRKEAIVQGTSNATEGGYSAVYLRENSGEFTLATSLVQGESADLNQAQRYVQLPEKDGQTLLEAAVKAPVGKAVTGRMKINNTIYTMAVKALPNKIIEEGDNSRTLLNKQPTAILVRGTPETDLNKLLEQSFWVELITLCIALIIIFIWAMVLKRAIITPIKNLQQTAKKFAVGVSTASAEEIRFSRCEVFATDEIGDLVVTFNQMADRITEQVFHQENEAKLAIQLNEITARLRESLNSEKILKGVVHSTRDTIQAERVLFYRLDESWQGKIIAESVAYELGATLGANIPNPCLVEQNSEEYEINTVIAVENIKEARFSEYYLEQLELFGVQAYLLAPIFVNQKLYGLFVAHQCSSSRKWQDIEINLFRQVAIQVGYALEQAELLQQIQQGRQSAENLSVEERQQKEALQSQLLELLEDIEGAALGDLTVRADVSEGEIGTVADFFNSIVESLRLIVTKVKASAMQVNNSLGSNEKAIRQLAEQAIIQAAEINHTLDAVDKMTFSMKSVAESAQQAASVANRAKNNAERSGEAMVLTVHNIRNLRETVGKTAKKVKHLGESTQEISRVVSLINQIALQTNLLAINAGIEAMRAGEQGQGFAVVAEEVGELAARSAFATQEIEQIVENIQRETSELVQTMELETAQVVEGTRVVEDAKHSLSQILDVSREIDFLVQSISTATVSQVETSQTVGVLMKKIAKISQLTSTSSRQVSQSLQETVEISQELQQTVETFKVS